MIIIDINRQGNIKSQAIYNIDLLVLQIKSVDVAPIWITINDRKCKQVLYESQWGKWRAGVVEKLVEKNLGGGQGTSLHVLRDK